MSVVKITKIILGYLISFFAIVFLTVPKGVTAECNGRATVTGVLVISTSCDGQGITPLKMGTGAAVTINFGVTVSNDAFSTRNGDPISVLSSSTSASLINYGNISTIRQWGVTVNSGGVLESLVNFGTISSGSRRGIVSNGSITSLTNVGTISGPFAAISNYGSITTFNNLQGSSAVTLSVSFPTNYNIIINSTTSYGRLSAVGLMSTGSMAFNIYGNAGTTLVSGVSASTVTANRYLNVLEGFTSLSGMTGTTGNYDAYAYTLVAAETLANAWDLLVVNTASGWESFMVVQDWSAPMGRALAAGLPAGGAAATPEQVAVFTPLQGLSPAQMLENQRQMAPMIYADTLSAQRSAFLAATGSVSDELASRRGGASQAAGQSVTTAQGMTFWMQGSGTMQHTTSGPANQPGYTVLGGGATVGVDAPMMPGLRLGLAVGVAHQGVQAGNGGHQSGEVGHLTGYGSYTLDKDALGLAGWGTGFVEAQASLLAAQGRVTRTLEFYGATARGDTASLGAGGQVKGGVRMDVSGWQVEPSLAISALRLYQGGLNEYGAGPVGVNVNRGELTSVQSLVGVRVDRGFAVGEGMRLVASVSAAWSHEMGDEQARVSGRISGLPGAEFALSNAGVQPDALVGSAQAVLEMQTSSKLFVAYYNSASQRTLVQSVMAGLRYSW